MNRSLEKRPFIDVKPEKKVLTTDGSGRKSIIETWSRASMISPDFMGHTIIVRNDKSFIPVFITENMVGHKLGEFTPMRTFHGHSGNH